MDYKELDLPENEYDLEEKKVINLSRGDLNFLTPDFIIEEAYKAMKEGFTHYIYRFGENEKISRSRNGLPELLDAISTYYSKYGPVYNRDEITVTNGSAISLYMIFNSYLKEGDEIIVTDPSYPGYFRILEQIKAKVKRVPLEEELNWRLNTENLKNAVSPKTKMIAICNPLNPTGKVFTKEELKGVSDIAIDNDLKILSDEIYNEYIWKGNHFAISSIDEMKDHTIVVSSFSKTFSMTGWRLGYILSSKDEIDLVQKIPVGHTAATFIQKAGASGLRRLYCHDVWGPPTHIELWRREILRRLRFMQKELDEISGVECPFPDSTFYLWTKFKELGITTKKMYEMLASNNVMVDPGTKYGPSGEGFVRIGMVQPFYYLEEAVKRIKKVISTI